MGEDGNAPPNISEEETQEIQRLKEEAYAIEAGHEENLINIDKLQRELRSISLQLITQLREEEDAQVSSDDRWVEAERAKSEQEWLIKALQEEFQGIQKSMQDKREREAIEAEQLKSIEDTEEAEEELVKVLMGRERRLRELEDRSLTAEELYERKTEELNELLTQHDEMVKESSRYFTTTERLMLDKKVETELLTTEYKSLQKKRDSLTETLKYLEEHKRAAMTRHADGIEIKASLEAQLHNETTLRNDEIVTLTNLLNTTMGEEASNQRITKLDEAMMIIKAYTINVQKDRKFMSDIFEVWSTPESSLDGFHSAFAYLKQYVTSAFGEQPEDQRWVLCTTQEARYDEVESLLSAIKQLVVCYDIMGTAQKRRIECGLDIIRNSSHVQRLAVENGLKFKEMLAAREERRKQEDEAKARKLKNTLEKSRLRVSKKRPQTDIPPSEREPSERPGARSGSIASTPTTFIPPKARSASPKLAPVHGL